MVMISMGLSGHDEHLGVVEEVNSWGAILRLRESGELVFLDQTKAPRWTEGSVGISVGGELTVVVLDPDRDLPRVSALPVDIDIARNFRVTH